MSLFSGLLSEMMLLALNCWSIIDSWLSIDIDLYLPTMKVATNVELCWRDVPIQLAFLPVATFLAPVKKKSLQRTASVVVHLPADLDLILIRLYNLHSRRGRWNWIQKRGKGREMTIWYTKFLERERDFYLERRVDRKWNWRRIHCWRSRNNCRHRSSSTAEWTANCRSRSGTWPSRYSWDSWSSRASSTSPRPRSMSCRAKWRPSSMAASPGARTSKCPEILLLFFFFFEIFDLKSFNVNRLFQAMDEWAVASIQASIDCHFFEAQILTVYYQFCDNNQLIRVDLNPFSNWFLFSRGRMMQIIQSRPSMAFDQGSRRFQW